MQTRKRLPPCFQHAQQPPAPQPQILASHRTPLPVWSVALPQQASEEALLVPLPVRAISAPGRSVGGCLCPLRNHDSDHDGDRQSPRRRDPQPHSMLPWRLERRKKTLPGARLVQDLLQYLPPGELVEQFLILESGLEQGRPLGLRQRTGGVSPEQLAGVVRSHFRAQSGPSRSRSSLRQRKSQVYKVLIEPTFNCFWISIKLSPCNFRLNISLQRAPKPLRAASSSSSRSRRTACSSGSGAPPAKGRSSTDT